MTIAMGIAAIAVHYFMQPSGLIVGSISGLSIVIYRITGIPVSALTFSINLILLVLAYFLIGKEFGIKTVYTALILSPWLRLFEVIDKKYGIDPSTLFQFPNGTDYWFYLLGFVVILSATQAILFNINASTGGLDIIAKIVNKYLHIDLGTSVTVAGAIICCSAFFIPGNSLYLIFLGFIGTWINGIVVDYFTAGLNAKKRVCIISPEYEKIRDYTVNTLKRGCTLYPVKGGYSQDDKVELQAILTNEEFAKLMEKIKDENIHAFITAGRVSEVYGLWLRHSRKHSELDYNRPMNI
ncbi:MAG: YitT family protein [Bacteroidales bacterium]|nr:YitT family protein [Bacteroidales bacterium]MBQ7459477.1 YitT family protein [Bacteroidales bacterium]MBQ9530041.1 YitT family protein [Bacteroidales bacterium]